MAIHAGAAVALRQCGQVGAGGTIALYAADVRQQVSLQFLPRGYEWAQKGNAVLSLGYSSHNAGVSGHQKLPAAMLVANANTQVPLKVRSAVGTFGTLGLRQCRSLYKVSLSMAPDVMGLVNK